MNKPLRNVPLPKHKAAQGDVAGKEDGSYLGSIPYSKAIIAIKKFSKMIKLKLLISISFLFMSNLQAQRSNQFSELTNSIFFKIRSFETNQSTLIFLKKHVPFLAEKSESSHGWSVWLSTDEKRFENNYFVSHTLEFKKHPFIQLSEDKTRLEITTKIYNDTIHELYFIDVWYYFTNLATAEKAFDKILDKYKSMAKEEYYSKKGSQDLKYTGYKIDDYTQIYKSVQLKLHRIKMNGYFLIQISDYVDVENLECSRPLQ